MRHLDNRDNGLDILQLAYMDHTMGIVIILPRVKTNPLWATKSWRPTNLLAATPLQIMAKFESLDDSDIECEVEDSPSYPFYSRYGKLNR